MLSNAWITLRLIVVKCLNYFKVNCGQMPELYQGQLRPNVWIMLRSNTVKCLIFLGQMPKLYQLQSNSLAIAVKCQKIVRLIAVKCQNHFKFNCGPIPKSFKGKLLSNVWIILRSIGSNAWIILRSITVKFLNYFQVNCGQMAELS